ncbi:MAG TPA: polysaccharide deacetylase family protein [Dinghuibacter sp.]|uniref:glycosyl hydrolase 2 galactose-binding domain-containing protein n=1 Tax=Dinghuibacter sp. TaxID=2024697 RepID=UPI002B7B2BDE|nr:polysaccharide deacetylase family protein [Dinghuibacter sp.]HTJ14358.1 polysaccharide deacetylase family protein [Dinghuibacter sp.]
MNLPSLATTLALSLSAGYCLAQTTITKWPDDKNGAVSITYDDASRRQFTGALPLMERLQLPATFFVITGPIDGSEYKGKFIGRPIREIIGESATVPTNEHNFLERCSAAGFLGYQGTIAYHTHAGNLYSSGKKVAAYRLMDSLYAKVRHGDFAPGYEPCPEYKEAVGSSWEDFRKDAAMGYEIASHSVTHATMPGLDEANIRYELEKSKEEIENHLGKRYVFSAEVPYGYEDQRVMQIAHTIYPALRNRMPEPFLKEIDRASDALPHPAGKDYVQWQRGPLHATPLSLMTSWVDTACANRDTWLVLVFHGIDSLGWEWTPIPKLEAYLQYIKAREDRLWIATFGDVTRYMREKESARIAVTNKGGVLTVSLTHPLDKYQYDLPLTLRTRVPAGWKRVVVRQGAATQTIDVKDGYILYPVKPNAEPATLQDAGSYTAVLKDGWDMQSATRIADKGDVLSQASYTPQGWYKVSVPTTIIAGLMANKVYDFDPFYGMNFEKLKDPSLDAPWWFRTTFTLPAPEDGKDVILTLHGINYKANVWLNGVLIADSNRIMNPYRVIELNVTPYVRPSGNVLALEIRRPINPQRRGGDLAIDYADWIHYPPDYNGGIVNDISVRTYDRVGIQYPLVTTRFDLPSLDVAHLTVEALVTNYSQTPQDVVVKGRINTDISFQKKVHLNGGEIVNVVFTPADFPQLNVRHPRIWWPWQYGKPGLNRLELSVGHGAAVSNTISEPFGIRQVTSQLIDTASRVFIVNGKRILLRGAAWAPDIFQRRSPERQEQEIRLYRDMNMNIVRSEGKMEDDNFYALCDKYGMLVMTGWMCCGAWQYPENWDAAKRASAMASDTSVMRWLRNKPSLLVWLNGSDMPPRDTSVERGYLDIEASEHWPNPTLSTANSSKSRVSGYSGVKMDGPYEWVPPVYWETDSTRKFGGAWSLATEISPGPSIPPYESLIKFIPADSLWFTTATWKYHCGTMTFGTTDTFNMALQRRYGRSTDIRDYLSKAQAQDYEAHRAMMEAYGLHKYHDATGVVQWMGSNPWPGLIWHTYDYYLYPAGTYFGMKKAMEPVHVMYSYATGTVNVVNSLLRSFDGLQVEASVFDLDGRRTFTRHAAVSIGPDSAVRCFAVPATEGTYFLRLQLTDAGGAVRSVNWYWLSSHGDALNWRRSTWYTTPQSAYADYTAFQTLGKTTLSVVHAEAVETDSARHYLRVTNTGHTVAFQVHLRVLNGHDGDDILPVIFSDNYIELAPGETREIRCSYAVKDEKAAPHFVVTAWNVSGETALDNP